MKKVKKIGLKRLVSLVLSVMLLAGIVYIPKVSTSDALAGLPDEYANMTKVGELTSAQFGRCRGINPTILNNMPPLEMAGTPMATAGYNGVPVSVINLYWNLNKNNAAIYCMEPSADFLPTSTPKHDSDIYVDSPVDKGHTAENGSKVDDIELEQTKLLSYALAFGQQNYPNGVDAQLTRPDDNYVINPDLADSHEFVRGAATQLIVWAIAQQWYKNPDGSYNAANIGIQKNGDPASPATGLYKYIQNYPNVQRAMQDIWAEIWAAMAADEAAVLNGVSHDPNHKTGNNGEYIYTMTWNPVLGTYIYEVPAGPNLINYEFKSTNPDGKIIVDIESKENTIIITGDPGVENDGGVIVELKQRPPVVPRHRAVVGYIVSARYLHEDDNPRDQTLITGIELYDACAFSDNRAYFKVIRPEETTALIQKKIDENDTREVSAAGFMFDIYYYDNGIKGDKLTGSPFTTDNNGQILLKETSAENLTAGRYWIEETEQTDPDLDGYTNPYKLIKAEFTVTAKSYNTEFIPAVNYFEFENKLIDIIIEKKLDERSGDTPDGFEFDIYEINETGNGPDLDKWVTHAVTDEDGIISLNGEVLPKGTYWIVEILTRKSAKYYLINRKLEITNTESEQHFILLNELIELKPVKEVERGDDKSGFEFDIYIINETDDGPDLDKPVAYVVTDDDGVAKVNEENPLDETPGNQTDDLNGKILPKGRYWVKERLTEKSKKYYLVDEEIEVVDAPENIKHKDGESDKIQYFPMKNELRKVVIDKTMSDDPDRTKDISGIKFRIYPLKFKDYYKNGVITWEEIINGQNDNPDDTYFAEEFEIDANGNYTLEGVPEGHYQIEELPHEKNKGYYLIDEEITICESGFYLDGSEIVEFETGGDYKDSVTENEQDGRRYIIKPLANELIPENKKAIITKILQNSNGRVITPPNSAVYEVTLTPYGLPDNRKTYIFQLNFDNGWKTEINVAEGEYIISETSGGENYTITYSPVVSGTNNRVNITGGSSFSITVTNREKTEIDTTPPVTTTTNPTTQPTTNPTTQATTSGNTLITTEPQTTTQSSTEPTIPEPTTPESSTEPTVKYDEPTTKIPLDNGYFGEYDEEEDVWNIYDENDTPLVIVKLPEDEDIEDFDFGDWTPPLANIPPPAEEQRDNPKTNDNFWAVCGMFVLSATGIIITRKRLRSK